MKVKIELLLDLWVTYIAEAGGNEGDIIMVVCTMPASSKLLLLAAAASSVQHQSVLSPFINDFGKGVYNNM